MHISFSHVFVAPIAQINKEYVKLKGKEIKICWIKANTRNQVNKLSKNAIKIIAISQ